MASISMSAFSVVTCLVLSQLGLSSAQINFVCTQAGLYPHPDDCAKYYQCASDLSTPYVMACAPGTFFSGARSECDRAARVECGGSQRWIPRRQPFQIQIPTTRWPPLTRRTSRWQPQPQPTTRWQPQPQPTNRRPQPTTRWQPRPQPTTRWQPRPITRWQPRTQPTTRWQPRTQPTTRWQPRTQPTTRWQPRTQPTRWQPRTQPTTQWTQPPPRQPQTIAISLWGSGRSVQDRNDCETLQNRLNTYMSSLTSSYQNLCDTSCRRQQPQFTVTCF